MTALVEPIYSVNLGEFRKHLKVRCQMWSKIDWQEKLKIFFLSLFLSDLIAVIIYSPFLPFIILPFFGFSFRCFLFILHLLLLSLLFIFLYIRGQTKVILLYQASNLEISIQIPEFLTEFGHQSLRIIQLLSRFLFSLFYSLPLCFLSFHYIFMFL